MRRDFRHERPLRPWTPQPYALRPTPYAPTLRPTPQPYALRPAPYAPTLRSTLYARSDSARED